MEIGTINYDQLKSYTPGGKKSSDLWLKPTPTQMGQDQRWTIRIIPQTDGTLFYDTTIHYLRSPSGTKIGVCPKEDGGKCPACDIYWDVRRQFNDKTIQEALRNISPTTKIYVNAILRGVEKEVVEESQQEVQIWALTWRLWSMINEEILTNLEDGIQIVHPTEGRDIVAKVVKMGNSYKVDTISVKGVPSPVPEHVTPLELEPLATQTKLTAGEVAAEIPKCLGGFYDEIMEAYGKPLPLTLDEGKGLLDD